MTLPSNLERIYQQHAPAADSLLRRFASTDAERKDLLQDWLIRIAQNQDRVDEAANERAYVLRIAYRLAVDWTRRNKTRAHYHEAAAEEARPPDIFQVESSVDRELLRKELEGALVQLPREQQLVVQMKLWDELQFQEIADVLDIPLNTAASRYRYGLQKLREALQPLYNEVNES